MTWPPEKRRVYLTPSSACQLSSILYHVGSYKNSALAHCSYVTFQHVCPLQLVNVKSGIVVLIEMYKDLISEALST